MSLLFAFLTILFMVGISASIAYGSTWGLILFIILVLATTGYGFSQKAKRRREGR